MQLPNIWGDGGALFAFSGMDGETDWRHPLVGSTLERGRGFVFHVPGKPVLRVGLKIGERDYLGDDASPFDGVEDEVIGGGVVVSRIRAGQAVVRVEYVFLDNNTVGVRAVCETPTPGLEVFVEHSADGAEPGNLALACSRPDARGVTSEGRTYAAMPEAGETAQFSWAHSAESPPTAAALAESGSKADIGAAVREQIGFFRGLPSPNTDDPALARAFYKCASVMKVNCCSPQDQIRFRWTTPDRWPHRHMWIWDSAFHAIGLRHISAEWAEDAIMAVLSKLRDNGFIPHTMTPDGSLDSNTIQPPILAWGSWKVYETTGNRRFLEYVYPRIASMLRYDCDARDSDKNGLSEWEDGAASGMDNSPRFDQPVKDAVDLNCFIVNDMRNMARIAGELGYAEAAVEWLRLAEERAERINSLLWDEETRFYYDNAPDGGLIRTKTESGFTPLLAGICDNARARHLVEHLTNPAEFWRAFPIPSVSADEPSFSDNMWRGPVWVNYNYLLVEALRNYGYMDIAARLRLRTLEEVTRWHEADGLIYEFFDSEAVTDPVFLHRKKLGGPQAKKSAASLGTNICDYNFTASLYVDLLQTG